MRHIVQRADGTTVQPGETLISFRGEAWSFIRCYPSRGTGRVEVENVTDPGWVAEYFPSVFDLGPVLETTRYVIGTNGETGLRCCIDVSMPMSDYMVPCLEELGFRDIVTRDLASVVSLVKS